MGLLTFNCVSAFNGKDQSETVLSADDLKRFAQVITIIKKNYYKSFNDTTLFTRAISGMLSSLDPHSAYLDKEALNTLEITTLGKLGGIGVVFISDKGLIKVISPLDDTPAYRAGIKSGDVIIQINNKFVRDMSSMEAANMMRGQKGTMVTLTVVRENVSKPLVFNLRREIIKIKTVKERILEPGYGYIRLAEFQEPTEGDMIKAIRRLQRVSRNGLKGVILDVRDNPGGLVSSAVQVADDFLDVTSLKDSNLIVYAKGQNNRELMSDKATHGDMLPGVPIVVLINAGTASAAEIVAGALQDHKRAIVIGTRSFGKGSMQTVIPIDRDTALKLTTALYYTPLGRSIQATGIEPDINVENIQLSHSSKVEQELPRIDEEALVDHIPSSEEEGGLVSKGRDKQQKQSKEELALAYKDYQLYEALHILKSQNIMRHNTTRKLN